MKKKLLVSCVVLGLRFLSYGAADLEEIERDIAKGRKLLYTEQKDQGVTLLHSAVTGLNLLIKMTPDDPDLPFKQGRVFFYLQDDSKALGAFDKALALDKKYAPAYFFKGLLAMYSRKDRESVALFQQASGFDPENTTYKFELARALRRINKVPDAERVLRELLKVQPESMKAKELLAGVSLDLDKKQQAYELYKEVMASGKAGLDATYNFGQLCQTLGKHSESVDAFRKVLHSAPDDWMAMAKLIQGYQALNQPKKRDMVRTQLFELRDSKKVEALNKRELYCREQFSVGAIKVMVLEYFELKGERAIKYSFMVKDKSVQGTTEEYKISLGSYDSTNEFLRAEGSVVGDDRGYHLDGYFDKGLHRTYGFFYAEPEYAKVRQMVVGILEGKIDSVSSSKPTTKGSEITISQ